MLTANWVGRRCVDRLGAFFGKREIETMPIRLDRWIERVNVRFANAICIMAARRANRHLIRRLDEQRHKIFCQLKMIMIERFEFAAKKSVLSTPEKM